MRHLLFQSSTTQISLCLSLSLMKSPASSSPMIQCVPGWDPNEPSKLGCPSLDALMTDYEVAELTWENGQLALHGLRQPRIQSKAVTKEVWDKPCVGGTLECLVNQATRVPSKHPEGDLVPWFQHHSSAVAAASAATMDALVPCSYPKRATAAEKHPLGTCPSVAGPSGSFLVGSSTHVDSCSDPFPSPDPSRCVLMEERSEPPKRKRTRDERGDRVSREVCSRNQSASGSASLESTRLTLDTRDMNTSLGSPENTSSAKPNSSYTKPTTVDDHDSVCRGKSQMEGGGGGVGEVEKKGRAGRSSISSKRSRAAAIHNQSERKRRDRINQRMNALQKLVPNSSKTDKASMLDEVIEYLKQLQAQVHMMSRINTPQMMMPMTMQQLQMSMMAHMGMGMGMGMGMMDMNGIIRSGTAGIPPMFHPAFPLLPAAPWDGSGDRLRPSGTMLPDPFSAFLACQTQSMNMDAYKKMVALYQQLHQPPCPNKDPRD